MNRVRDIVIFVLIVAGLAFLFTRDKVTLSLSGKVPSSRLRNYPVCSLNQLRGN